MKSATGKASERRKYPRGKPAHGTIIKWILKENLKAAPPKIVNLGAKGACVVSEAPLHPGEVVDIEITVPELRTSFKLQSRVRWTEPCEDDGRKATRIGLEFDQTVDAFANKGDEPVVLEILHNLRVAVAQLRLYRKESPQVLKVVTDTFNSINSYLGDSGSLALTRTPRGLLVNGRDIQTPGTAADSLQTATLQLLSDSQIKSISCKKGMTLEELVTFLHALTRKFWDVKDGKEINRRLREERVFRITVDEVQYVALGEGDIVIEDATRKLQGGKTALAQIMTTLDQLIESGGADGLGSEARLEIMKKLLQQDPNLLKEVNSYAQAVPGMAGPGSGGVGEGGVPSAPAGDPSQEGRITWDDAREGVGEVALLLQHLPALYRDRVRRLGWLLARSFRHAPHLYAVMNGMLTDLAAQTMPLAVEELAEARPSDPAAVLRLAEILALPDDEKITAVGQEGGGLVDELWALGMTDKVRSLLESVLGFIGDRTARRRLSACRALAGLEAALARNATPEILADLDRSVRSALDQERDPNVYHALMDMSSFLADLHIRQGRLEAARSVLDVLLRHYRIKEEGFVQRAELAYIALERVASGAGFASLGELVRTGEPDATKIVEALGASASRFLIREIKGGDTAARRILFAQFIARAGPSAATVLLDEIQKTTVPSDLLKLVEVLPQAMPPDMAEMALPSLLRHGAVAVRRRASTMAAEQAYPNSGRLILDAMPGEPDGTTRASYIESLGRLRHKPAVEALCEVVDGKDQPDEVRIAACLALGRIGDVRAVPVLKRLLYRGEKGLTKFLRAVSAVVRAAAARGLSSFMGSDEAREALRWAQEDRDATVRSAALQARYAKLHEAFGEQAMGAQAITQPSQLTKELPKFGGILQELSVESLCRTLGELERTGLLQFHFNGPVGKIYFDAGLVIAADLENRRDLDAFNVIIGRREGQFLFLPDVAPAERRLLVPIKTLLQETLGRPDAP